MNKSQPEAIRRSWVCPRCGCWVQDYPAISRKDNATFICSACGSQEAIDAFLASRRK